MSLIFAQLQLLRKRRKVDFVCDEEKIHCELLHGVEDNGGLIQQTESHVDQFVILEAIDENQQLQLEKNIFSENQDFILNANKEYVWSHIEHVIPKIFFFFRPNFCAQLAATYIVRQTVGKSYTDEQIQLIIASKKDRIYRCLLNTFHIAKQVYASNFILNHENNSKAFQNECITALLEVINLNRDDTEIKVPSRILQECGAVNTMDNIKLQYDEKWHKRTNAAREICMYVACFQCSICSQHFTQSNMLHEHIRQHTRYECLKCEIECTSYKELVVHYLTFCRHNVLAEKCIACNCIGTECKCFKKWKQLLNVVKQYWKLHKDEDLFKYDIFSILLNFNNKQSQRENGKSINTINETINEEEITQYTERCIPHMKIHKNCIVYNNEENGWADILRHMHGYFENVVELNRYMIEKTIQFTNKCTLCDREKVTYVHYALNHPLEFNSRTMISNVILHRCIDATDFLIRIKDIKVPANLICELCQNPYEIVKREENVLNRITEHILSTHNLDYSTPRVCPKAIANVCNNEEMTLGDFMLHNIILHYTTIDEVLKISSCKIITGVMQNKGEGQEKKHDNMEHENLNLTALWQSLKNTNEKVHPLGMGDEPINIANKDDSRKSKNEDRVEHQCYNEDHKKPIIFETALKLKQHVVKEHKCPSCTFSTMLNVDMLVHYKTHEGASTCLVCYKRVEDVQAHLRNLHAQCVACKVFFEDRQQLKLHEPNCSNFIHEEDESKGMELRDGSLALDSTDLEGNFSDVLIKLLESSALPARQITGGTKIIKQFAAESAISKNRLRLENISIRRKDALFFDVPSFVHAEKSNLPKVLAACGNIKEIEKFDGTCETAKQNAVKNFEIVDNILCQMEKFILLGSLNERQAISVLEMFLTQRIVDEISSYCNEEFKSLSYVAILETCQFLYIPLNLEFFESKVMSYKQEQNETFLEFSSRVYRHLKLCSRLKAVEMRKDYIEINRCKILKNSLPQPVLESIIRKESLYNAFTSRELLDHVISYSHRAKKFGKENQFQVRQLGIAGGTLRGFQDTENKRESQKRFEKNSIGQKSALTTPNSKKFQEHTNIKTHPGKFAKYNEILKKYGYVFPTCYKCLDNHLMRDCKIYNTVPLADTMCYLDEGKRTPMGFHGKEYCKHAGSAHKATTPIQLQNRGGYSNSYQEKKGGAYRKTYKPGGFRKIPLPSDKN